MTGYPCRPLALFVLLVSAIVIVNAPAYADAIDGQWCSSEGRKFSINGSHIVTPDGTRTTGDYDRHAFAYTLPQGGPGAGTKISMLLVDENTLHLQTGANTTTFGSAQIWQRCSNVTS